MRAKEPNQFLIDEPGAGKFRVRRDIFTDPGLFDLEMERIFEGSWLYLAHESQLPRAGDFVATRMGRQPVIVNRSPSGKVSGFINACAHRGATLCRTVRGNKPFFTCSYHGWVYDADGHNLSVKDRDSGGYAQQFERQSHDLTPLPRLESYRGFIFGSLNPEVPELVEHLGDVRWFIDLLVEQSPDGVEVLPGSSTYTHRGNWKLQPENGLDGYHFTTVHANYLQMMKRNAATPDSSPGGTTRAYDDTLGERASGWFEFVHGHGVMWATYPMPRNRPIYEWHDELTRRLDDRMARWVLYYQRNTLIYPNLLLQDNASTQIRVVEPLAPDRTAVRIFCLAPVGESPRARALRLRQYEDFFNATGVATPDDLCVFEACHDGFAGLAAPWQQGYERGTTRIIRGADKTARELGLNPVASGENFEDEGMLHGQFKAWRRLMGDGPQPLGKRGSGLEKD